MRPAGPTWTDAQVRLVIEAAVSGTVRGLKPEDEPLPLGQIAPRPAIAAPVQIWDGDIEIVDGAGDPVGTVHAWGYSTPADHVFEILEMTDPTAYFSESTLRYRNLDTTNDPPWTVHQDLEAAYSSSGSSRWGMAVTEHLTGISNATIEGKLVSPSLTGMTATWYRVEVGSGST